MGKSYVLIDDDGDIRFIFPNLSLAFKKKEELGWGHIYQVCDLSIYDEELM